MGKMLTGKSIETKTEIENSEGLLKKTAPFAFDTPSLYIRSSLLSQIRQNRNVSQRSMAKKMNITRTQLQRMEKKKSEKLFLWELSLFAGALHIPLTELVQIVEGEKRGLAQFTRCSLDRPFTAVRFEDGVELDCIMENPSQSFVGRLNLSPQKSFQLKRMPGLGSFSFMVTLQGCVSVEGGPPTVLRERDGFFGENLKDLIIHNTEPIQRASILIFLVLNNS